MADTELSDIKATADNPSLTLPPTLSEESSSDGTTKPRPEKVDLSQCSSTRSASDEKDDDPQDEVGDVTASTNDPSLTLPPRSSEATLSNTRSRSNKTTDLSSGSSSENPPKEKDGPQDEEQGPPMQSKYDHGWRRIVRNFSPSWFSITMGTGVVSILFSAIPFQASWLHYLSIIFFILNILLFTLFFLISLLRYTLYPPIWTVMIHDSVNSLFLGTIPIGFATLIEAFIIICVPHWGAWSIYLAFSLWVIDAVAALAITLTISIIRISEPNESSLRTQTALHLLPIASSIVASNAAAAVALILIPLHPHLALGVCLTGYTLWGLSMPLAGAVLVIYYQRLTIHKMPPREIIVSCFLPLGPLGMGGYSILYLGRVSAVLFPLTTTLADAQAGPILLVISFLLALVLWAFAIPWLAFALASLYYCRPFPFNMGWWGFTFPLGVFALSTIELGSQLPSLFFRVLGTVLAVVVILLWCVVAVGTVRGARSGVLFHAPCLEELKVREEKNGRQKRKGGKNGVRRSRWRKKMRRLR